MKAMQLAVVAFAAFVGGAVVSLLRAPESVGAAGAKGVEANEFILMGNDGKPRARLELDSGGAPRIRLEDGEESTALSLTSSAYKVERLRALAKSTAERKEQDAKQVKVAHILLSFKDTRTATPRTKNEAERMAAEVLALIDAGRDFSDLLTNYSDDSGGGTYTMLLTGPADQAKGLFERKGMVAAFGDVGWRLKVGEVGVAPFDSAKSPFGWHIIKRLE